MGSPPVDLLSHLPVDGGHGVSVERRVRLERARQIAGHAALKTTNERTAGRGTADESESRGDAEGYSEASVLAPPRSRGSPGSGADHPGGVPGWIRSCDSSTPKAPSAGTCPPCGGGLSGVGSPPSGYPASSLPERIYRGGGPLPACSSTPVVWKKACGRPRFEASPPAGRRPEGAAADPRRMRQGNAECSARRPRRGRTVRRATRRRARAGPARRGPARGLPRGVVAVRAPRAAGCVAAPRSPGLPPGVRHLRGGGRVRAGVRPAHPPWPASHSRNGRLAQAASRATDWVSERATTCVSSIPDTKGTGDCEAGTLRERNSRAAPAGSALSCVANGRLRHMLIGYARV